MARRVGHVFESAFPGGFAMDTRGNLSVAETATTHLTVRSPAGEVAVLAADPALLRRDGCFISRDRQLYVPVKHPLLPNARGAAPNRPTATYAPALPTRFAGLPLGDAITGA